MNMAYVTKEDIERSISELNADGEAVSEGVLELLTLFANGTATAYEEGFQDGLNAARTEDK